MRRALGRAIRRLRRLLRPRATAFREMRLIVDAAWYRATYPDVAAAGEDPVQHFLRSGIREGRRPNRFFDPIWYLRAYPDAAGQNPVLHYVLRGRRERRDPGPFFSLSTYLDRYPDVARTGTDPLEHFIRHGQREGRVTFRSEVAAPNRQALESRSGARSGDRPPWPGWMEDHPVFRDEALSRIHETFGRRGSTIEEEP